MAYYNKIVVSVLFFLATQSTSFANSTWSFLTYMEADNSLAPFTKFNIGDMQKVGSTSDVNILVQLDQIRQSSITYRYKVLQNRTNLDHSIGQPMGINPGKELVNAMSWVKSSYPAENYALVLWNHGNGVLDRSLDRHTLPTSWFQLPGLKKRYNNDRGILYNDLRDTFLDNPGLSTACSQIKSVIGKNIDFLGADACLMAMIEVAFQVKDSVSYLVASQETEPGYGWPYADILSVLAGIPQISTADFATAAVQAYANFYRSSQYADPSFTQSAINVSKITAATTAFNTVLSAIQAMMILDKTSTQKALNDARAKTQEFYIPDYVDLINLYNNLTTEFGKLKNTGKAKQKNKLAKRIVKATNRTISAIAQAKAATLEAVIASQAGPDFNGNANGLSIYFPADGRVASSYKTTFFAQQTNWVAILAALRS